MLNTPLTATESTTTNREACRQTASRQVIVSIALVIAAIVAVFVALSTVTPVAFAALGFLPLIQHRLMSQLTE